MKLPQAHGRTGEAGAGEIDMATMFPLRYFLAVALAYSGAVFCGDVWVFRFCSDGYLPQLRLGMPSTRPPNLRGGPMQRQWSGLAAVRTLRTSSAYTIKQPKATAVSPSKVT